MALWLFVYSCHKHFCHTDNILLLGVPEVTSCLGKYHVRCYYVNSSQENTVSSVTLFRIARSRERNVEVILGDVDSL